MSQKKKTHYVFELSLDDEPKPKEVSPKLSGLLHFANDKLQEFRDKQQSCLNDANML